MMRHRILHPDSFKDADRPEEWVKLKYFSIVDDIDWNDLNDEADTQYYYIHTLIPNLQKVNGNTRQFYSPEAFGHFIQGALPIARSFISNAVSFLNSKDPVSAHLDPLRFWNLDTGHALRIRRNVPDETTKKTIPSCIDIISVLDLPELQSWTVPQLSKWDKLTPDRQKDWGGIPANPVDNTTSPLPMNLKAGDNKTLVIHPSVDIAIRIRNTCFYKGDHESEIGAWILGNDSAYDDNSFKDENEKKSDNLYDIDKKSAIDDFTSKYAHIEERKSVNRRSRLYTSLFAGIDTQVKKVCDPAKPDIELKKRFLPRFVKISAARKWVFYPESTGNFKPEKSVFTYKTLYPSEDMALAIYTLIKSNDKYIDSMHDKTFIESDLDSLRKVKVIGVNVVVMIFEKEKGGTFALTKAWIDGEAVTIEDQKPPPPVPGTGGGTTNGTTNGDTTVIEDDTDGPIKALMKGMYFDTSKSFLLPSALPAVKKVADIYDYYSKVHMLIVGHTDTAGTPAYNSTLSMERAQSLKAYLLDDWKTWYNYYTDQVEPEKKWGDREDRLMIQSMPDYKTRKNSEDEIVWYQITRSLKPDGVAGAQTREKLIKEYMSFDNTSLPANADVQIHGCGESHPAIKTGDNKAEQKNRRVEIFFFPNAVTPPPKTQCPDSGCTEYQKWIDAAKKDVVLDDTQPSTSPPATNGPATSPVPATPSQPPATPPASGGNPSPATGSFVKPKRAVDTIFLHCTASDNPAHDSVKVIDSWHKANGWGGIGYHYFVRKDGVIETGRNIEKIPAAQSSYSILLSNWH